MYSINQNPIFVVGYPRSGTTLLQALLSTQGDLTTFPETHFFSTVFAGDVEFCESIDLKSAENTLNKIASKSGLSFSADFLKALQTSHFQPNISVKTFFESLVCNFFPEGADTSGRWIEKTPDHGLHMHKILRLYPEAKFVGIIRDPFWAIHSRTKYFTPHVRNLISLLSKQWVKHVKAFEDFQAKYQGTALLIRYEDLTKDPEDTISNICRFLEITFEPQKLVNYQVKAESIIQPFEYWKQDVMSASIFNKNEKPQNIFSIREILKIQSFVLQEMKRYGYQPKYTMLQKVYDLFK